MSTVLETIKKQNKYIGLDKWHKGGAVGQIYRNTLNGLLFKCKKVEGIVYTWADITQMTIGTTQPAGGIWLEEVV